MGFVSAALTIFKKDLLLEMRGKEVLSLMLFLSLLLLVIFNFAMDIRQDNVAALAPGILWVIYAFAGVLGMGRTSMAERDEAAYLGVVFSPASTESFYLGKVFSNFLFLLTMELFTLFFFALLFSFEPIVMRLPAMLPSLFLGTLGFALIGTLFSFLSTTSRYGEVLLPFIYLPVVVPVILGGVSTMTDILLDRPFAETFKWLQIMAVFDVLYFAVSLLLFHYLFEE